MSKSSSKSPKPAVAEAETKAKPGKRSRLKLALFALALLVLAGGGYAVWTQFLAAPAEAAAGHETGDGEHAGVDPVEVSAVPPEIAAESSFTHSYALSVLAARQCGRVSVPALKAASDAEARADGLLATLSWQAAARRVDQISAKSCGYFLAEIADADAKAAAGQAESAKGGGSGHGEKKAAAGHH